MKYLWVILLSFTTLNASGQRFYNINFNELPQDYQLYPRDDKNQAIVPISGQIEVGNWSYISVIVYRNKQFYGYFKSPFVYDNMGKLGAFSVKPIIKAELAEYDFKIYASQSGKDSVLTFERKNVVSGDAYLIYGQSNGRAWEEDYKYQNEYCRTFGFGSYQNGYTWGLSNSGYTGGFNGEQFIVGEWGIDLQKNILENYKIPTCVINASTSGANIKTLSDRNENNPADIETHYGRLIYMAQKSGVINNIKGFFYWQAETDAVQAPSLWKPGFDKMYNYWTKDLPSVKKIYTFQIPLFGAGEYNDEVGVLRDYLRKLGSFYPKITTYAPLGITGWNGWHFDLAGYQQIAKELSKIVGKDFYGEQKTLISPNIQKTFYSKLNRSEITLAFEQGQQMIYPKDTVAPNIGGGFGTYSLKDFFYLNGIWQKVQSGRAEGNKIILTLKQPAEKNDSLLKYLPSIYPYSGGSFILKEAPWIYIGPFLKNSDGMRAFAFHNLKISPFVEFEKIVLTNTSVEAKKISLKWNVIANANEYVLERISSKDTLNIQWVKQFPKSQNTFTDSTLQFGEEYIYRVKALSDLQESDYGILKIKTVNDPTLLTINSEVNYFNSITLSWIASLNVQKPNFYTIGRKMGQNGTYAQIAKVLGNVLTYKDTTLSANVTYHYQVKSSEGSIATLQGQTSLTTPDYLVLPQLTATALYFNSIKLSWNSVKDATFYVIEKSLKNGNYQQIVKLDANLLEWTDKDVAENTNYSYRIKAFAKKTESQFAVKAISSPALLTKPDLTTDLITTESIKLLWKAIPNANKYVLERQLPTDLSFQKIFETPNLLEFVDVSLKNNQIYTYRLKAYADVSESDYVKIEAKTLVILANEYEENDTFKVFPNPTKEILNVVFAKPITGELNIMDAVGRILIKQNLAKQNTLKMDVSALPKGIYFMIIQTEDKIYSRKIAVN